MGHPQMLVAVDSFGEWKTATVAKDASPALSGAVDLGGNFEYLNIIIPTLDSANLSIYVSDTVGGTYQPLGLSTNIIAAGTGGFTTTLLLGGYRFIKILLSETQTTAARAFSVRGYRG